ncbi:hypothetical protein [Micromonospora sp. SH-82]|uniref:hypothetical protein n=1 Tax=Micromonospora sp. SH-82 TaxID=3132938 RepID=UPI003EB7CB57
MNTTRPASYRRHRLLARAYPPGPRRAELLDTLLMVAEETGRTRPTAREVVDVLSHAPRARLGRPGNRVVVPVAVVVAILTGFVTASLTARLHGETDRPLPTTTEMADIAELVTPGVEVPPLERHDRVFVNGNGEAQFSHVRYQADHVTAIPDLHVYGTGVAARLTAAGWRLGPTSYAGHTDLRTAETLTATRNGWVLTFDNSYRSLEPTDGGRFDVSVRRAEPAAMPVGFAAGGLLGLVSGWFLTGWASRRSEHHTAASGVLVLLAVVAAGNSVFLVSHVMVDLVAVVDQGFAVHEGPIWSWTVLGDEGLLLLAPTILAVVTAGVVLTLLRRPHGTTAQRPARRTALTPGGWTTLLTLTGLAAISACTALGYVGLIVAAVLMTIVLRTYLVMTRPAGS